MMRKMQLTNDHPLAKNYLLLTVMLTCCLTLVWGCKKNDTPPAADKQETVVEEENQPITEEQPDNEPAAYMAAPEITPDANGFISLKQATATDNYLRVELDQECTTAKIYYDDLLIQTITDEEDRLVATGDDAPIHFLDANFDGYADILIGPCESRTYSTLLLWDDGPQQFHRVGTLGDPSLQNFMIHPASKTVFEGGSCSWCCEIYTKSIWNGRQIVGQEELIIVNDPEQYGEYEVNNKYTIRNADHEEILSAKSSTNLPELWQGLLNELEIE